MSTESSVPVVSYVSKVCQQWHAKLGHLSLHVLRLVLNKIGLSCSSSNMSFCDSCKIGKLHQLPFARHEIIVVRPLQLVYYDL